MMDKKSFVPKEILTFDTVQSDSQRFLQWLRNNKYKKVRFDLSNVVQCDSAGLALLIEAKRLCLKHHKELIIEGMPKIILAWAKFCGVDAILMA